jgi:hypothetical protein
MAPPWGAERYLPAPFAIARVNPPVPSAGGMCPPRRRTLLSEGRGSAPTDEQTAEDHLT